MKGMAKLLCLCAALTISMSIGTAAAPESPAGASESQKPLIQMAILLDTSGSMRGLIAQAKTQLWKIVNEFIAAERDGQTPELQVALYEYGKSSIPKAQNYLRMILPLTTDLDKVSEELFALKTRGGQEYCGTVIQAATNDLAWSQHNDDLKAIFIAGNERFTQGSVDYRGACGAAVAKGIIVNTIHCGSRKAGLTGKWEDGATLGKGEFMNIDQNRVIHHVSAPQDKRIVELDVALNKTYIPYGHAGKEGLERQVAQDANALRISGGVYSGRARSKVSAYYVNPTWDLVDAIRTGKVKLEDVKKEALPAEMQKMAPGERKAYVAAKAKERDRIKQEVEKLSQARKQHVAAEMKKRAKAGAATLDEAMIESLRKQAKARRFKLK